MAPSRKPEAAAPWQVETLRKSANSRKVERDPQTGVVRLAIVDDFGEVRDRDHGLVTGGVARERLDHRPGRPAVGARRDPLDVRPCRETNGPLRTETFTTMSSDAETFHLTGRIEAYEGDTLVFARDFEEKIPRNHL